MSARDIWPLFGLRVRTPRLELRYPTDEDLAEIADRAANEGIHDPAEMPFGVAWTDVPPPQQQRNTMQFNWGLRAAWQPGSWNCNLAVVAQGRIVGMQSVAADDFATLRTGTTGSFLFRSEQGRGLGTEARMAILHLLFAGLDADSANSSAWKDNARSRAVSIRLGYQRVGSRTMVSRGCAREMWDYRLSRRRWESTRRDDIHVDGLEPCRTLFGVPLPRRDLGTCVGVDGCKAGWLVATRAGVDIAARVADVLGADHQVIGIDMPIGLPDNGGRAADSAARRYLSPRGSTIFSTPVRACLAAVDYEDACARSFAASGKKLSLQSWHIVPKIAEIDAAVSAADEQRVIEVHPECSFAAMNGDRPLASKHTSLGLTQRCTLIEEHLGLVPPERARGASRDDILDAFAVLWTAERFAQGRHRELGGAGARDARGLLMRIVV